MPKRGEPEHKGLSRTRRSDREPRNASRAPRHADQRLTGTSLTDFWGTASYYGSEFRGRRTASGERFNPKAMTAAHKTLPLGSRVRVTNLRNGKSVEVTINDRGPYTGGRIIDLSKGAARKLDMIRSGTAKVRPEVLAKKNDNA